MLRIRKRAPIARLSQRLRGITPTKPAVSLLRKKVQGDVRTVFGAYETPNASKDRKNDRYEIDPKDYMKAEDKAREFGLEIVGVYHSHPDHPDRPFQV
ncbi:MAG: Mov34/MPN/PAD-1 family protein [Aquificota bacterium]|nr:Mov34/MPN/PAD-1 family protein [Aquificota bacterium]